MNIKKLLLTFTLTILSIITIAQGTMCSTATPFCTAIGTPFTYQNVTGTVTAQAGPDYGCLLSQPRPSWFYIKSSAAGAMTFSLTQSTSPGGAPNIDVDFIAYGPYSTAAFATACSNLTGGCVSDHNCAGNTEDCSYDPAATETMTLNATAAGQYFIIMITNFDGTAGFITFTQTGGPASDCSITCPNVTTGDGFTLWSGLPMSPTQSCDASSIPLIASDMAPFGSPIVPGIMLNLTTTSNSTYSVDVYGSVGGYLTTLGPLNANTNIDYQLYYMNPGTTYTLYLCESNSAQPDVPFSIMDLASGVTFTTGTWVDDGACQAVVIPAGTITGIATFTGSCGGCVTSFPNGQGYFNPSVAGVGTHTVTYTFDPGAPCTPYVYSKVVTVVSSSVTTGMTNTTICQGASATLTVSANPTQTFSNTSSFIIPDGNPTGVSSPIIVSGINGNAGASLASINVNITHAYDYDIDLFLVAPSGYTVALSRTNGGSGANYTNTTFTTSATGTSIYAGAPPFTGTYIPEDPIYALSGSPSNGTWRLFVKDNYTPDQGTITSWRMNFVDKNTYNWSPAASLSASTGTNVIATPSVTTVYTITASSNPGCVSAPKTITVTVNPKPTLTITPSNTLVCSGNTVSLTGSGASTYTWTGGITNGGAFTPTASTSYTLNATSSAGCTNTAATSVSVNTSPTVAISSVSNASICSGGSSLITPSGASTYTLLNTGTSGTSFNVSPSSTTTYSIVGTSASSCPSTNTITTTINVNTSPTVAISSVSNPTLCSGNSSLITPSGASTYTLLNTGATGTSFNVSPSSTTTYSIVGASASSCPSTNTITTTINVSTTPTVAISSVSNPTLCSGNSSLITPSGASTYTLLNTGATGTSFNVSPSSTTTYSIVGASASSCVSNNTITTTINVSTTPTVAISSVSNPTLCSGNSSLITPSGASTYTLLNTGATGTSFNVSPSSTTTYSIVGASASSCVSNNTITTTINVSTTPTVAISSVSNQTLCSGNSSLITPSGASTYTLLNTGATGTSFNVSPSSTTTYSIVGASASSCPSTNTITTTINVSTTPTVAISSVSNPSICSGNSSLITPSGASTYTLLNTGATGTSFNVSPSSTTTYSIVGASASSCVSNNTITTTITVNSIPTTTATTTGSITCVTNTINLNSSLSGMNYTWTAPGGASISGSPNLQNTVGQGLGTYTLFVSSPSGCTYSTTISAIQNTTAPTSVNAGPTQTLICGVPTVTLTGSASGGATANWLGGVASPNSFTTTTGSAGTYTLQAINPSTGCFITSTVQVISSVGSPSATANAVTNSITCTNSVVAIGITPSSAGPFTYQWSGPGISGSTANPSTTATLSGVYNVTLTNSPGNNCSIVLSITVPSNTTAVTASISPTGSITCAVPTLTLNASPTGGSYTYTWTGSSAVTNANSQNPSISNGGTYSVAITNTVNGCVGNANITVNSNTTTPVVTIAAPSVSTTCSNPTITISASSSPSTGVTYSWTAPSSGSLNQTNVSNPIASGSGIFTVVVTNTASGCSSSLTQNTVSVSSSTAIPTVTLSTNSVSITCTNPTPSATISTSSSPVTYSWSPTSGIVAGTETSATPQFSAAGSYSAVVTNTVSGCSSSLNSAVVNVVLDNTTPNITLSASVNSGTITCTNTVVTISPTVTPTSNLTYTWLPSGVTSSSINDASFSSAGVYTLAVTNTVTGCVSSSTNSANTFTVIVDNTAPTPTIATAPSVTTTCASPDATLSATSDADPNTVYTWTSPTSNTLTGNPIVSPTAGIYTVIVTNTVNGCSTSSASQATVEVVADAGIPTVTLSTNSASITCSNPTPSVTISTSSSPVTYSWSPSAGIVTGTETSATPQFSAAGSYSAVVTNTNSGCASSINSAIVTVVLDNNAPTVTLSSAVNSGTITCTNTVVTISPTVTPTSNLTYTWLPSGVTSSSINDASFTSVGVYTLVVTNTVTGCVTSSTNSANTFTVVVDNAAPSASINVTSANTSIGCGANNATVTLNGSSSSSSNPSPVLTWLPGSVNNSSLDVVSAGDYTLVVVDAVNGCSDSTQITVTGNTNPPQGVDAGTTANIPCGSSTVTLNGVTSTTNTSFSWAGPSATSIISGSNTANPMVGETGDYTLTVTDNATGCSSSAVVNVSQSAATASITADPTSGVSPLTVNFTGDGVGNSFNWNFGDSNSSTQQDAYNIAISKKRSHDKIGKRLTKVNRPLWIHVHNAVVFVHVCTQQPLKNLTQLCVK
jgi:hypothetical protein